MNTFLKLIRPLLIVFILLTGIIFATAEMIEKYNADKNTLLIANVLLLVLFILVLLLQKNALKHINPNVWMRTVMLGMMFKMLICAIAVLVYVKTIGDDYNKKSVIIALFFYLIYLFVEVKTMTKLNPGKNA
ncbi:MAG: hypothetical protein WD135_06540 [Ferruginibacter sp.]